MRRGENRVLFGAASTLVFVNNIHERPQIVAVRHYSLTFIEALSPTCLSSSPIMADYLSSLPARLHRPFAHTRRLHCPIVADRSVFGTTSHSSASSTVWRCVSLIHDPYIRADFSLREYYSRASSDRCRSSLLAPLLRAFVSHLLVFVTDHGRLLFSLPARLRLHRRLNFTARLSSSPGRPYSSPLPLAKTIVFANIVCLGP